MVLLSLARQILERYLKRSLYILSANYSLSPYIQTLHSSRCFQRRKTNNGCINTLQILNLCFLLYEPSKRSSYFSPTSFIISRPEFHARQCVALEVLMYTTQEVQSLSISSLTKRQEGKRNRINLC